MEARFFYAEEVDGLCPKLFVLTKEGRFYSEYLESDTIRYVDEIKDLNKFTDEDYYWEGVQSIKEIEYKDIIDLVLKDQENWINDFLIGEILFFEQELKIENGIEGKVAIFICDPISNDIVLRTNLALSKYIPKVIVEKNKKEILADKQHNHFIEIRLGNNWCRVIVDGIPEKGLSNDVKIICEQSLKFKGEENVKIVVFACNKKSENQISKMNDFIKDYMSSDNHSNNENSRKYTQFIEGRLDMRWCRVVISGIDEFKFENLKDLGFVRFENQEL